MICDQVVGFRWNEMEGLDRTRFSEVTTLQFGAMEERCPVVGSGPRC